jgi:hypothetical protein
MEVGVHEAALTMGVSDRRARAMLAAGQLPGRQVAGRWLVEEANLPRSRASARPMSPRIAWALIGLLSGDDPHDVEPSELTRLRHKRHQLHDAAGAPRLLRSWLPRRAERRQLSIAQRDLDDLRNDPRVLLSGISDPRSELSSAGEVELYVARSDLEVLSRDYLLSVRGRPNVTAHVIDRSLPAVAPVGLVVADLADYDRPREDKRAMELLRTAVRSS